MVTPTSSAKIVWKNGGRSARVYFAVPYVGELTLRVETELPGAVDRQTPDEQKELARRNANLLLRNLMKALAEVPEKNGVVH